MTLIEENASRLEFCRLCYELKNSFVDIFETVVFKEDCLLVDKLKDLYGVEASTDDEMSKFICIDCLRNIKTQGDITYGLWSTLDYLLRMHEEQQMERTSFNISKESLDFLFSEKKECLSQPVTLSNDFDFSGTPEIECSKNKRSDCVESEVEEPVEYCWCSECNAEFLNKGELRVHLKAHDYAVSTDNFCEATDSVLSSEEYKLISGEFSLLRSQLCCSRCQKEFKSEKRLVQHIMKHDFKCKPRNFECLNSLLNSLKSITPEGSTLLKICSYNSSSPIDSKIHDYEESSVCGSYDFGSGEERTLLLQGNVRKSSSRVSTPHVGSHIPLSHSLKQDTCCVNSPIVEGNKSQNGATVLVKSMASTCESRNPYEPSPIMAEKSTFGNGTSVDGGIVICDYCNKSFLFKSKLREHIVMCHLSVTVHKCFTCYFAFSSERQLRIHCAVHGSKSKYICTLCNDNFTSKPTMSSHLKEVHKLSRGCICSVCFLGFSSQAELSLHHVCHSNDKKYKCSKCGKAYMDRCWYNAHVRFCQLKTLAHQCEVCGKYFPGKRVLDGHSYTHGSDKRFPCHLCPKKFTQGGRLLVHIRSVHLQLKPHECGICKKKFTSRSNLISHYAVHSDERPFSCQVCGKCFKLKADVHGHLKRVHGKT